MNSIIDRLIEHVGIDAVLIGDRYRCRYAAAPTDISEAVLEQTMAIMKIVGHDVRVVVGSYTISGQYHFEMPLVVAIETGHKVAKSIRRMIHRARKDVLRPKRRQPDPLPASEPLPKPASAAEPQS